MTQARTNPEDVRDEVLVAADARRDQRCRALHISLVDVDAGESEAVNTPDDQTRPLFALSLDGDEPVTEALAASVYGIILDTHPRTTSVSRLDQRRPCTREQPF